MLTEHLDVFILQQQHVLRYVAIGVAIAAAAGIIGYLYYRKKKAKSPSAKK